MRGPGNAFPGPQLLQTVAFTGQAIGAKAYKIKSGIPHPDRSSVDQSPQFNQIAQDTKHQPRVRGFWSVATNNLPTKKHKQ